MTRALFALHARAVTRRPGAAALALAVATIGALLLLPRFRIDPDVGALLPAASVEARLLRDGLREERAARTMFLVLRGPELEARLPSLVESLRASPSLAAVEATRAELASLGGFGAQPEGEGAGLPSLAELPLASLEALEARLSPAGRRAAVEESLALLAEDALLGRELVRNDPLGLRWILDEARRTLEPPGLAAGSPYLHWPERELALFVLRGRADAYDVAFSRALLADLEERLAGVEWEALGGYEVARRDAARMRADMSSSLVWSIPLLLLFLALSSRSLALPLLYVAPVLLAVLWALGYGGALIGPLTPLAVGGAAILMGLGVDFALHYLDRYRAERAFRDHPQAVLRAHQGVGPALLLGMGTSVMAFLSVAFGSFPGLTGFGLLLAFGLIASFAATLCLAPLLGQRFVRPRSAPPAPIAIRAARALRASSGSSPAAGALFLAGIAGWALVAAGQLDFDADPRHLRPEEARFAARAAELEEALGHSPLALRALVPAERGLTALAAGLEELRRSGDLARITGAAARAFGPERAARLALFRERTDGWHAGALADLSAAGFHPDPFRPALDDLQRALEADPPPPEPFVFEGRAYQSLALHPATTPVDRAERAALRERVRASLGPGVLLLDPAGAGDELGPLLARDLARSLGITCLVVLALLALVLRRPRAVAAALSPAFVGLGLCLGLLALADFPVHPGNLIALPLILGLGVDDGIHLVLRWREGDADPLATTGASIWRTSVTTILAFGSLATAASPAIASLGLLAAAGALSCFVTSVVLVPALLGRTSAG